ncbi:MAG: hypothetical protein KA715_13545 [Xanthomonadaceae bacterium]|nr:hypothetical protein [Xanthomonadaceae bacterium]
MKTLNAKLLEQFLNLVIKKLEGEWVLLGGTLIPALGIEYRQTVDIDFVPAGEMTNKTSLELMGLAEKLGIAVESINASAGFFLKKIPDFSERLVSLKKSKSCTIYRPTLDLYLELKLNRASPTDLTDCIQLIQYCKKMKLAEELKSGSKFLEKKDRRDILRYFG